MSDERPKRPQRSPTMDDVALLASVSQMTVSRVMRKKGYISKELAARVTDAAASLGYVHNRIAGGLAGERNALVGVVLPTLENRVFTEVLSGVTQALGAIRAQPVFGVSEYGQETEAALVRDLLSWRPMGLILPGLEHDDEVRKMLAVADMRVAEVMDVDGTPVSACFGVSQARAGADMARHLLDKGYRRFGYVGSLLARDLRAAKRFDAFRAVVTQAGGQICGTRVSDGGSSMTQGRRLTAQVLEDPDRPQAIYYANDDLAAGGLMHCLAEGLDVPGDVALAGFNGLEFLDALPLMITTSHTPRFEIGRQAGLYVSSTEEENEGPPVVDLGCEIVPGQTS